MFSNISAWRLLVLHLLPHTPFLCSEGVLLASGAAHQRCYVRRRKRVEDDRAKVDEEEARVKELRARSRAGKERLTRISEGTIREWQGTMDGWRENPDIRAEEEEEEEALAKTKRARIRWVQCCLLLLCCTSFLPWFLLPFPLRRCYVGCSCSCIGGHGSSKCKGGCGSVLRTCVAHLSHD
jgi:hypothetical protein